MSIFDNVFNSTTVKPNTASPLTAAVFNARASMEATITHLLDALHHIGAELDQARHDVSIHQDALANAQARVDQFQQAALHLAAVGQGVENLLAAGQEPSTNEIPAVVEEVQNVVANAEQVVAHTEAAVAPAGEPAPNV